MEKEKPKPNWLLTPTPKESKMDSDERRKMAKLQEQNNEYHLIIAKIRAYFIMRQEILDDLAGLKRKRM